MADQGASVKLNVSAIGSAPLGYQWQFNGAPISGATTNRVILANAQVTNSGNYFVIVSNAYGSATSRVASITIYPPQATVFPDAFETNSAARWTIASNSPDTRVIFNYDYSTDGIPAAPHSAGGTTRGVKFQANLTNGTVAAINMSPLGQYFFGDYRLRFDMWINANGPFPAGGAGSTQFLTAGIGTAGNRVEWLGPPTASDGYWFSVDGQGGVPDTDPLLGDFAAYAGTNPLAPSSGVYWAGSSSNARDNGNPYYGSDFPGGQRPPSFQQVVYPQQSGALAAGTVGFVWCDVIISIQSNTVEWSINGLKIATITNASFNGRNVSVGYWAPYPAVSDNEMLSFGLIDNLRVEQPIVPPTLGLQPHNQSVNQGGTVIFSSAGTGTPSPAYQWRFNGTNIAGATTSVYTLINAQPTNAGFYSLVLTNLGGVAVSTNALLTVNVPPSISGQPQTQTVNQGAPATFTVSAGGTPPLGYQWYFGGFHIPGATGSSFTITNTRAADAGVYSVIVTNVAGHAVSTEASLFVNIPPLILRQPQSVSVNQGSLASFSALATGTVPLSFQWRFNGAPIAGATSSAFRFTAQPTNAGAYSVVVSNVAGSALSSNAILTVNVPPTISGQPVDQYVNEGDNVSFTVGAAGTAPLMYQWWFNGGRVAGGTSQTLSLAGVTTNNAGTYSVVVSNVAGFAISGNATLRVNLRPVADASATQPTVISSNGATATVVLDGSRSYDLDGDSLRYLWFTAAGSTPLATGVVAVVALPVGTNALNLVVADALAAGTNSFTVAVLNTSQAVKNVISMLNASTIAHPQPLIATLSAAMASIARGDVAPAINQLQAFQNKVSAQIAPSDPALAAQLINAAQQVIDALSAGGDGSGPKVVSAAPRLDNNGRLSFNGTPGQTYILEASTNLVDWEMIGVAVEHTPGAFEFQDRSAPQFGTRFYKVISP